MSPPFDRFGPGGERTILVPNPGGRRPANGGQTPFAPVPEPGRGESRRSPGGPDSHRPGAGQPGYGAGHAAAAPGYGAGPAQGADDWATPTPSPVTPGPSVPTDGEASGRALVLKRDVVVAPNENPFLQAAGPLLLLFGRLRVQLSRASSANLIEQVAAAIEDFAKEARAAGAQPQQIDIAKYIVCATADDVVQNIPTDDRNVYTQHSMLSRFFGERRGGVRFFEELDRAKVDPSGNYHLLELQHACLAMGFQGIHRTSAGGAAALQQIQRNLYELLRRTRPATREISPRWQGQEIAQAASQAQVPLWATGAVVMMLLMAFYLLLRFLLSDTAEATATALVSVHPQTEIGIQR
ncbi:type IVB secretion system protein IcmH/DotU, partial [Methylobacterium sp. 37f]|uniref:type IVB secretion system protein IcmH/DotU n=1 Tax=Methylobacterium sp. 37f TaxID=2817058 RepID=UPI001FFC30E5|nr:type IVB secretion system protein IcmH/DotU [Methylobacterium sp. 37f]